jgi:ABC-2 type transport system permease protein
MAQLFLEIRKHWRLWLAFMKSSLAAQLEYRANFLTGVAMEIGYLLVKLMFVLVVYQAGVSIQGLTPDEVLLFSGCFVLMTGFYAGIIMMNLFAVRNIIRDGSLDLYITKPVSLQFMITLRRSDLGLLMVDGIAGITMIATALARLGRTVDYWRLIGFAGYLACACIVAYGICVIPALLSFWFTGSNFAGFMDVFWDFNSLPMGIYNRLVQNIGLYVLPIFLITNVPALYLLDRMTPLLSLWGILAPLILFVLARIVFKRAIRRYESASG